MTDKEPKGPGGRPTTYTKALGTEICAKICSGQSVNKLCKADDMPAKSTVFLWLIEHAEFSDNYVKAKEQSGDVDQDKLDSIAERVLEGDVDPAAARVAADIIKWSASKKKPKKYGDRQQIDNVHSGTVGVTDLTDEQLDNKIQEKMRLLNESEGDES